MTQSMTVLFDELCELVCAARETDWHSTVSKTVQLARDVRDSLSTIASSLKEISITIREMKALKARAGE